MQVTHAMVLAAGLGTRMRPLTDSIPKPLVRLAGKPLIDHVLDRLADAGIETAVINLHYHADKLEDHLRARSARGAAPEIVLADERDLLLDTGGGTLKALSLLGDKPFITFNSDSVWEEEMGLTLRGLMNGFDPERMDALLLIADSVRTIGYVGHGDFEMDPLGRLTRRKPGTVAPYMFAGVQIIKPEVYRELPEGPFSTNLIWNRLIEEGRAFGWRMRGTWMHVGAPDDLEEAEEYLAGRNPLPTRGRER